MSRIRKPAFRKSTLRSVPLESLPEVESVPTSNCSDVLPRRSVLTSLRSAPFEVNSVRPCSGSALCQRGIRACGMRIMPECVCVCKQENYEKVEKTTDSVCTCVRVYVCTCVRASVHLHKQKHKPQSCEPLPSNQAATELPAS